MITLRPYQREAIEAVLDNHIPHPTNKHPDGYHRFCIQLPTGTGKTITFAALIRKYLQDQPDKRALILVHREELANQAADKMHMPMQWPDVETGIVQAHNNDVNAQVVVASVQTLARENRREQIDPTRIGLVVVDEAHHASAQTYQTVLKYFRVHGAQADPARILLGVTATPIPSMGLVFQTIVYRKKLVDMIRDNYLSPIVARKVFTTVSLNEVQIRAGDYDEHALESVINTDNRNDLIVQAARKYALERKIISFTVNVAHAEALAKRFNDAGFTAESLTGQTPKSERRDILRRFQSDDLDVITNCAVLTEGFDAPICDCIILARPTQSPVLYMQAVGRGLRTHPGKDNCLLLDIADRTEQGQLASIESILNIDALKAAPPSDEDTEDDKQQAETPNADMALQESDELLVVGDTIYTERVDLFETVKATLGESRYQWMTTDRYMFLQLGNNQQLRLVPSDIVDDDTGTPLYSVFFRTTDDQLKRITDEPMRVDWAQRTAEDFLDDNEDRIEFADVLVDQEATWRGLDPKAKQIDTLEQFGLDPELMGLSRGEASDLLSICFELADTTDQSWHRIGEQARHMWMAQSLAGDTTAS